MAINLAGLVDHLIVCGYGRMGRLVCQEFSDRGLAFVVIERQADLLANFEMPHGIAVHGDATSDEILKRAGAERARALVAVVGTDADNLYIVMSARLLNDKLFIVARAGDEHSESKLTRAGANRVVSPYLIGGLRVAHAILRPTVVDFIELVTQTGYLELELEETQLAGKSPLIGATIRESGLRKELGLIIVAIKNASGQMLFNPPPEAVLQRGDILIALGKREQIDQLLTLAKG
jgi:voltage-gated potassium channel